MGRAAFTKHAEIRLAQRTSISPRDIELMFVWDLMVPIGIEQGTKIVHELFYSAVDCDWFVAIYDERTRETITVLPYHWDRWRISQDAMNKARDLAINGPVRRVE
jgi:hypothetical protein